MQELEQRERSERGPELHPVNQSQHSLTVPAGSGGSVTGPGTGTSSGALADESRVGGLVGAGMTFFRGGRLVKLKSSKLDPMVSALTAGLGTLISTSEFSSFFPLLAEFVEKLRQFDALDPWDVFQRCYTAMETFAEKDKTEDRKKLWPGWLEAWCKFLEFYRACAACLLSPFPRPCSTGSHMDSQLEPGVIDASEDRTSMQGESQVILPSRP